MNLVEVKFESYLWLPIICSWEMPRGEFASKCSRIVESHTVYRSMKGIAIVPRIDFEVLV